MIPSLLSTASALQSKGEQSLVLTWSISWWRAPLSRALAKALVFSEGVCAIISKFLITNLCYPRLKLMANVSNEKPTEKKLKFAHSEFRFKFIK